MSSLYLDLSNFSVVLCVLCQQIIQQAVHLEGSRKVLQRTVRVVSAWEQKLK